METIELTETERAAFACPDCDSEVELVKDGVIGLVTVSHDDTCPTLRRIERARS